MRWKEIAALAGLVGVVYYGCAIKHPHNSVKKQKKPMIAKTYSPQPKEQPASKPAPARKERPRNLDSDYFINFLDGETCGGIEAPIKGKVSEFGKYLERTGKTGVSSSIRTDVGMYEEIWQLWRAGGNCDAAVKSLDTLGKDISRKIDAIYKR